MLTIKNTLICVLLLLCVSLFNLQAQEAFSAAGGNISSSEGSVSYTIGQMLYSTKTGVNGSVATGVQQPYEISVSTGLEEAKGINLSCSIYPNPTINYLTLEIENYRIHNLSYQIMDMNGRQLERNAILENNTEVSMSKYLPAVYFLKIFEEQREVKTFKIIKN